MLNCFQTTLLICTAIGTIALTCELQPESNAGNAVCVQPSGFWSLVSYSLLLERWESVCKLQDEPILSLRHVLPELAKAQHCAINAFHSKYFKLQNSQANVATHSALSLRQKACFDKPLRDKISLSLFCPSEDLVQLSFRKNIVLLLSVVRKTSNEPSEKALPARTRRSVDNSRSNHNGIYFEQQEYSSDVTEEQPAGVEVARVVAHSPDKLPLFYSMIAIKDGRSMGFFRLNKTSGIISTKSRLDREAMDKHQFRITAYESGSFGRSATANVVINVQDENDNSPVFEKSVYVASLTESVEVGTTVTHVYASDRDAGANGEVEYSILNASENPEFALHPKAGVLSVRSSLDRERKSFYRLRIQAADKATQNRQSSQASVEISIDDENDSVPKFNQSRYTAVIREDADPSSKPVIARVSAFDGDLGDNGKVHYSFVNGNNGNKFAISYATGEISLIDRLNAKDASQYELLIRAQDHGVVPLSATCLLVITIQDVNNFTPKFYAGHYQESVLEDVQINYSIVKIEAYDEDFGKNAELRYAITDIVSQTERANSGNGKYRFPLRVDPMTGWLSVERTLDRESNAMFEFFVTATDLGDPPLSSSVRVTIIVKDIDDLAPEFEQKLYNISLPETTAKGMVVCSVRAADADENSRIEYSFSGGNEAGKFLIMAQADFGRITLNDKLNYKEQSIYTLNIKATDSSAKFDTAVVYVSILDVNSPPRFDQHPFVFSILENEPIGRVVAILKAFDDDDGENARLTYVLRGSTDFEVDSQSGVLIIAKALDREKQAKYTLEVIALDHGAPQLSASTSLEVVLTDVNDNAPQFQQSNYSIAISEETSVGTSIMQITATDADSRANSRLTYHFGAEENGGSQNKTFFIDATSGIIRIERRLDREEFSFYNLTVLAIDKGVPAKTSSTLVLVKILDINDNAPRFIDSTGAESDQFHCWIRENSAIGTLVCAIAARDPDEGSNAVMIFKILGGQDMSAFEISSSATQSGVVRIFSRIELDYESGKNTFLIQLQAASGELSNVAEVYIHVLDVNDHEPILKDFFILFNNFRDFFPLHKLGRIPAFDPDVNDTLSYSLHGNQAGLLELDSSMGEITLSSNLNTNRQIQAVLKTCVSDGANSQCATCTLHVQQVTDAMLLNSITLRIRDATPESFLTPASYGRMLETLASIVPTRQQDVAIFSVRQDAEVGESLVLNVSLSVRRPHQSEQWISSEELKELVFLNRKTISDIAGLDVLAFDDNLCVREPCLNFERCQTILKFGNASDFIRTDNFIMRPIHPINTFVCFCPPGFAGMKKPYLCDTEVNLCYSSPCGANGTCIQRENGHSCLCPPTHTGPNCEYAFPNGVCLPGICQGGSQCESNNGHLRCVDCPYPEEFSTRFCQLTTRSFKNGAYLTLPHLRSRNRIHLQLSFATIEPNGLLFYNGRYHAEHDFLALELQSGKLRLSFSLGGTKRTELSLDYEMPLNDGHWHSVRISYLNRVATISVDQCDEEVSLQFANKTGYPHCAARMEHILDTKCADPTVPCHRFLDLIGPFYIAALPNLSVSANAQRFFSFSGCIKDVHIDRRLVDLSSFVSNHRSEVGCSRRSASAFCHGGFCERKARCTAIWEGNKCDCSGSTYAGQNCSLDTGMMPLQFVNPNSYVIYQTSNVEIFNAPFHIGVSFRTKQQTATLLSIELSNGGVIAFKLVDGLGIMELGDEQFPLSYPSNLADGMWNHFSAAFERHQISLYTDYILRKAVHAGTKMNKFLRILKEHQVKIGCETPDECNAASQICPPNSRCVENWDTHLCQCENGFVGARCVDVCRLNPCRNGGRCVRSPTGYACRCNASYTGEYCEARLAPAEGVCPRSWWGYPLCGPCNCDANKGYDSDCDQKTGICRCKNLHFKPDNSDVCRACDCFYPHGSHRPQCDFRTGQCHCRGDVRGRRCDTCDNPFAQVNASGHCEVIPGVCPESYSSGILWPKTTFGQVAYERCPRDAQGIATRKCSKAFSWSNASLYNCTSNRFRELESWLYKLDAGLEFSQYLALKVASDLQNLTSQQESSFYGRDVYISYRLLMALLRYELKQNGLALSHTREKYFVENIVRTANVLLKQEYRPWWHEMMQTTNEDIQSFVGSNFLEMLQAYGQHLAKFHFSTYMEPFQVVTENMIFAIDTVDPFAEQSLTLPKFNNFVSQPGIFDGHVSLSISGNDDIKNAIEKPVVCFYAILRSLGSLMPNHRRDNFRYRNGSPLSVSSPVFSISFFDISGRPVESFLSAASISFQLNPTLRRHSPNCVFWQTAENDNDGFWSSDGCILIKFNDTHATCSSQRLSQSFAILVDPTQKSAFLEGDGVLQYLAVGSTAVCLILLSTSFFVSLCSRSLTASVRLTQHRAVTVCLFTAMACFSFIHLATENEYVCKTVAGVLHLAFTSLFLWLFLNLASIYRTMTDLSEIGRSETAWSYQLVGWGMPLVLVGISIALSPESYGDSAFCWFSLKDGFVWAMIGPIGIVVLLILYLSAMCLLVAFSKEWELVTAKLKGNISSTLTLILLSFMVWILALLSANLQKLWLFYAYHLTAAATSATAFSINCSLIREQTKWRQIPTKEEANGYGSKPKHKLPEADKQSISSRPRSPALFEDEIEALSSAFHDRSYTDVGMDDSAHAVVNCSEAGMHEKQTMRAVAKDLNTGFLVVNTSASLGSADVSEELMNTWLSSGRDSGVLLPAFSRTIEASNKPDLIPSPDQLRNFSTSTTLPGVTHRSSFIQRYQPSSFYSSRSAATSPFGGSNHSSTSFTTFRRPVLSPAAEILNCAYDSKLAGDGSQLGFRTVDDKAGTLPNESRRITALDSSNHKCRDSSFSTLPMLSGSAMACQYSFKPVRSTAADTLGSLHALPTTPQRFNCVDINAMDSSFDESPTPPRKIVQNGAVSGQRKSEDSGTLFDTSSGRYKRPNDETAL